MGNNTLKVDFWKSFETVAVVIGFVIIMALITVPYVVRPGVGMIKQGRTVGSRQATQAMYEDYWARLNRMEDLEKYNRLPRDPELEKVREKVLVNLETLRGDRCNENLRKEYVRSLIDFLKMHPLPGRGIPRSSKIEMYEWEGQKFSATDYLNDMVLLRVIRADSIFYIDGKDFPKRQRLLAKNTPRHMQYQQECGREVYESRWRMVVNELVNSYWQLPTLQPIGSAQNYSFSNARFRPLRPVADVAPIEWGGNEDTEGHSIERFYRHQERKVDQDDSDYEGVEDSLQESDDADHYVPHEGMDYSDGF